MREALRGALLSVLFFCLLIGGAPSMASADYPTFVVSASGSGLPPCSSVSQGAEGGVLCDPTDASSSNLDNICANTEVSASVLDDWMWGSIFVAAVNATAGLAMALSGATVWAVDKACDSVGR